MSMFQRYTLISTLALTTAFSFPAMAGKDFIKKDLSDRSKEVVQVVGQRLSKNNLTFVVYGGNRELQMAAYRVAQRLDDEGIPIAFLLAPDHDKNEDSTHVDFYTKGGTQYGVIGFSNGDMKSFENSMHELAMKAVRDDFPQYIAANKSSSKTDSAPTSAGKGIIKKDCTSEEVSVCQLVGQRLSKDRLTFVVLGGNRNLQMAAYRVAQRFDSEGVPVAFLLAPDRDNIDITMSVEFYTKGGTQYSVSAYDNDKNTIEKTEAGLYEWAMKAVKDDFPQYLKQSEQKQ